MAERFTITVTPPETGGDGLTVDDAMRQVLDAFQLLVGSGPSDDSVIWRLVLAKTNSPPFTVIAEARSVKPGIEVDLIAKNQKKAFARNYAQIRNGHIPDQWSSGNLRTIAKNFLYRNCNGVASTTISLDSDNNPPIILTSDEAVIARAAFEEPPTKKVKPRHQVGSIEGKLLRVDTLYHRPAILVSERTSGREVWCLVDDEYRKQIADEANFEDVWRESDVRVRGSLEFDETGELCKVHAIDVIPIKRRSVPIEEIRDSRFTSGMSPSEYLDRFREGKLD